MSPLLAEIPLLDWNGPDFLVFFVIALVAVSIWCVRRVRNALDPLDRHQSDEAALDPFQAAFLCAGPPRVLQLTIARLVHRELVDWTSQGSEARLNFVDSTPPGDLHPAERALLDKVVQARDKGLPVNQASRAIAPAMRSIEVSLATLGLRPTTEERNAAISSRLSPLFLLLVLGVVKLGLGLSRDKPVIFLFFLLLATLVILFVIASNGPRLTASGIAVLDALRTRNEVDRDRLAEPHEADLPLVSDSVALFGPLALASIPLYAGIYGDMQKLQARARDGSSTTGCSTGCGTGGSDGGSGCGSGCGGCGGGGGD
jgi:uncharacterized protein (TIGR04222 family)